MLTAEHTASIPKKRRGQEKRAVHRSPQTEPTWPRSVSAAARPRRATERGKLPDGKPSPRRPRSFDTDRLTPSASTLPCVSRNRTSQPWLDCRTIHADRHLTHIPRCGTQSVRSARTCCGTVRIGCRAHNSLGELGLLPETVAERPTCIISECFPPRASLSLRTFREPERWPRRRLPCYTKLSPICVMTSWRTFRDEAARR